MKGMYTIEVIGEGKSAVATPSRIGSSRKKKKKRKIDENDYRSSERECSVIHHICMLIVKAQKNFGNAVPVVCINGAVTSKL